MARILAIQHVACESPGLIGELAAAAGVALDVCHPYRGDAVPPSLGDARGLVVLGGPMAVYEADRHPHLTDEMALCRAAVAAGAPVLGVCLGSQLLAAAHGAQVRSSDVRGNTGVMSGGVVFHLAIFVTDLDAARRFYGGALGCIEGRSTDTWVDFDFFGHQISLHLGEPAAGADTGSVDDVAVPMPHFGAVLDWERFGALAERLVAAGVRFVLPPQLRYAGEPAEQMTMFVADPSGNALEFKSFRRPEQIFEP